MSTTRNTQACGGQIAPVPVERSRSARPYAPPTGDWPIDLRLDANEGPPSWLDVSVVARRAGAEGSRFYPHPNELEREIAAFLDVDPAQVLVTAGGDEAIDRVCRAYLEPGRELVLPMPTFEMIGRYARLAGAEVVAPSWTPGGYPIERVLASLSPRTAVIAVVTPNNPTGEVAGAEDLSRLSAAAPQAVLLVDLAYTEFADVDLTPHALTLPNAILIRTFSKAFGLAGLRVGYAVGPAALIAPLRATGSPYPVGAWSLAVASEALRTAAAHLPQRVERVRGERVRLTKLLSERGCTPRVPGSGGQANFVLADVPDRERVWRELGRRGIAVRQFGGAAGLERALRITCPGEAASFERLCIALDEVLGPAAGRAVSATNSEIPS